MDIQNRNRRDVNEERAVWRSIDVLRLTIGVFMIIIGGLKLIPDHSPAEGIATDTVDALTFGLISGDAARILVGSLETLTGVLFLFRRTTHYAGYVFYAMTVGYLAPAFLFPDRIFGGPNHAPTLLGQYLMKDLVMLAAVLVVITDGRYRRR